MPEIRLGSSENFPNINLGSIELQEIWLGGVLVWQNNQGPIFASITWDGNGFTVPGFPMDVDDWSTPTYTSLVGQVNGVAPSGASFSRNITLVVGSIQDLDNAEENVDYIVGFRLQRPDGTWAYGDPDSSDTTSFGGGDQAPIADYGDRLPGTTSTYNASEDEFTNGAYTDASSSISVPLRAVDASGNEIDDSGIDFADSGEWKLYIIDSRGGESPEGIININLSYQNPNGYVRNNVAVTGANPVAVNQILSGNTTQYTNSTIGGPANATVNYGNVLAGPLTLDDDEKYRWSCTNCGSTAASTSPTFTVPIPQADTGGATPAVISLQVLGRSADGDTAVRQTIQAASIRSGPSFLGPQFTATSSTTFTTPITGGGSESGSVSWRANNNPQDVTVAASIGATLTGPSPLTGSVTFSGLTCGNTVGTTTQSSTTTVGTPVNQSFSNNVSFTVTGVPPGQGSTCNVTLTGTATNVSGSGGSIGVGCDGNCAGTALSPCSGSVGWSYSAGYTGPSSSNFSCAPNGSASVGYPSASAIPGTASLVCSNTNSGDTPSCTLSATTAGVSISSSSAIVYNPTVCPSSSTASSYTASVASITYSNGTTGNATGGATCLGLPVFSPTCSVADGTTGNAVSFTSNIAGASVSPTTYSNGSNTYTCSGTIPGGFLNAGGATSATDTATGTAAAPTCATGPMVCSISGPTSAVEGQSITFTGSCTNVSVDGMGNNNLNCFMAVTPSAGGGSTSGACTITTTVPNPIVGTGQLQSATMATNNSIPGCPFQSCHSVAHGFSIPGNPAVSDSGGVCS